MNVELKEVHIGKAIEEKFKKTDLNKSEFGRMIGVPQQHVNRLFERETIETGKLVRVSRALDFNFFTLFCVCPHNISANLSAVSLEEGSSYNNIGDGSLLAELEKAKAATVAAEREKELLSDQIEILKSQLADKDEIIRLYKEKSKN